MVAVTVQAHPGDGARTGVANPGDQGGPFLAHVAADELERFLVRICDDDPSCGQPVLADPNDDEGLPAGRELLALGRPCSGGYSGGGLARRDSGDHDQLVAVTKPGDLALVKEAAVAAEQ